jgi:hypothetical protein
LWEFLDAGGLSPSSSTTSRGSIDNRQPPKKRDVPKKPPQSGRGSLEPGANVDLLTTGEKFYSYFEMMHVVRILEVDKFYEVLGT